MRLTKLYFNHCHDLFVQSRQADAVDDDFYFRLAGKYTVKVLFGREGINLPFKRALAQLETEPTEPDLTICVWDSSSTAGDATPPCPTWEQDGKFVVQTVVNSGDVRIACEMQPNRLSMLSSKRNLGLFWIDNVDQFPWFEQCRPLRNIIHWWAAERRYYIVHAACVGYGDKCVLVVGDAGSGKSTTSMSALDSDMLFCSDDLCLIGIEKGKPHAYNLFNTGKLENRSRRCLCGYDADNERWKLTLLRSTAGRVRRACESGDKKILRRGSRNSVVRN